MLAGGFEDAVFGSGQKRPSFYSCFEDQAAAAAHGEEAGGDEEYGGDDSSCPHNVAKKRRLTFDQVRSLEHNFELENKLEPERKMQLAKELGLQPRQVAVWYQNRRARWKTKQLERDYEVLSLDYNRLKVQFDAIVQEKEKLKTEVQRFSGFKNRENLQPRCSAEAAAVEVSVSESEITTHTSSGHQQQEAQLQVLNSVPSCIKSERMSEAADQQLDNVEIIRGAAAASQWRSASTAATVQLDMSGSVPAKADQSKPELHCTSSESNSSELLDTGSPRSTIDSNNKLTASTDRPQAATVEVAMEADQSLVQDDVDPVLVRSAAANDFGARAALVPAPREYYNAPRSAIKLELDHGNNVNNEHEDQSCNYFLSQLDDKGCIPWWDWS